MMFCTTFMILALLALFPTIITWFISNISVHIDELESSLIDEFLSLLINLVLAQLALVHLWRFTYSPSHTGGDILIRGKATAITIIADPELSKFAHNLPIGILWDYDFIQIDILWPK